LFRWQAKLTSTAILGKKLEESEVLSSLASSQLKSEDGTAQFNGLCATHGFISKKSGIQSLVNTSSAASLALSAVESYSIMKNSPTVLHIEVVNVPVVSSQFKRLLQAFTFLEGCSFVSRDAEFIYLFFLKSIRQSLNVY
jgi:hypothetical protein